jgi:hypothetical protein
MRLYNYKEEDFVLFDGFFKLKKPISNDQKTRKYYKKLCPGCEKNFFTTKKESITCSDKCRSIESRKINEEIVQTGHYQTKAKNNSVELFTKSGYRYVVDNDDLDSVIRIGWTKDAYGYLTSKITISEHQSVHIKLHRFIMQAKEDEIVDHINGDVTDNRKCNLRIVNKSINGLNQKDTNISKVKNGYKFRIAWLGENLKRKTFQKTFKSLNDAQEFRETFKNQLINNKIKKFNL